MKLIFESELSAAIQPFLFFNFLVVAIITMLIFRAESWRESSIRIINAQLCATPSLLLLLIYGAVSPLNLIAYILFTGAIHVSLCLCMVVLFKKKQNYRPLTFFYFILIWGSNVVIETIPPLYNSFAPFTISYHFNLITDGILHVSTPLFLLLLIGVPLLINDEK